MKLTWNGRALATSALLAVAVGGCSRQESGGAPPPLNPSQSSVAPEARTENSEPRVSKLDPERKAFFAERLAQFAAEQPGLRTLRERLLDLGGEEMVPLPEPDLAKILARARSWSGKDAELRAGRASDCHANASRLWRGDARRHRIVTGYALTDDDGLWRQHTWALDGDQLVETTEARSAYYGVILTEKEAQKFAESNLD